MSELLAPAAAIDPPTDTTGSEDAYFVLRDCRELLQQRLGQLIGQSTNASAQAIAAFCKEFGEGFDELASSSQRDGFEQTAGLTASRISLVGNDDLELEIRIGDLASRLRSNDRIALWQGQLRFMTLLRRPGMTAENNPAGLQPISCALWALSRVTGGTIEQKLDQLDRLEDFFQARLPDLYDELNALLDRHHVQPATIQPIQRARVGNPGNVGNIGTQGKNNVLAALHQAMRREAGNDNSAGDTAGNGNLSPASGSGNQMLDAATLVMLKHLMQRLSTLEAQQETEAHNGQVAPLHALTAKDFDLPLGQPAAIALDTLSLIFEAIFATPELPDAIKAAIARLQIPLLKLALQDPSLFANEQHPARRLINHMARAALGLAPETGRDHPICCALLALAESARATLVSSDRNLKHYLTQLDALVRTRDQQHLESSRPYIRLVQEHQAKDEARRSAEQWLSGIRARASETAILRFLESHWLELMQSAALTGGTNGAQWRDNAATIDELLWSITPKQTPGERKKLLALIPQLLKRINAGLDLLAVSREERTPLLDACFELQTAALRGQPTAPKSPANVSAPPPTKELGTEILESEGKLVQYLGRPDDGRVGTRDRMKPWQVGDWIRFRLPDGEKLCGLLCWQSEPDSSLLLFNLDWGYAVASAPSLLEHLLKTDAAQVVTETALFDLAAEKALQEMASSQIH